jgi:ATP-dependent RNA helicase MSS116, mitochondrial
MSWAVPSKIMSPFLSFHLLFYLVSQNAETKIILSDNCHVLIATPGRLLDHFRTIPLAARLTQLKTVVFDEADRLLDQGFKKDLDAIMGFLQKDADRQSLLFSATIGSEIKKVRRIA